MSLISVGTVQNNAACWFFV